MWKTKLYLPVMVQIFREDGDPAAPRLTIDKPKPNTVMNRGRRLYLQRKAMGLRRKAMYLERRKEVPYIVRRQTLGSSLYKRRHPTYTN
jgi:hypothetical protein